MTIIPYQYVTYVGCYTIPGQADPFSSPSSSGVPHDRTKIGQGILAIGINSNGKMTLLNNGEPVVRASNVINPSYLVVVPPLSLPPDNKETKDCGNEKEDNSNNMDKYKSIRHLLWCVSEVEEGKMYSFHVRPFASLLASSSSPSIMSKTALFQCSTNGSYPCHIELHQANTDILFVSNYGSDKEGGSVHVSNVIIRSPSSTNVIDHNNNVDLIQTATSYIRHGSIGSNVDNNNNRQISSHAHTCCYDNNGGTSVVYTTDLGLDVVIRYRMIINCDETTMDDDDEKERQDKYPHYHLKEIGRTNTPPGSGPRSFVLHPQNSRENHRLYRLAAVTLELTAQVLLLKIPNDDETLNNGSESGEDNAANDHFHALGEPLPLLPPNWPPLINNNKNINDNCDNNNNITNYDSDNIDYDPSKFNNGRWGSDLVWSKDGIFLFVAARLHDSISIFTLLDSESSWKKNEEKEDNQSKEEDHKDSRRKLDCNQKPHLRFIRRIPHLRFIRRIPSGGRTPRCLTLSECGKLLLVAHQHSHDICSFRITTDTSNYIDVSEVDGRGCNDDENEYNCDDVMLTFVDRIDAPCAACVKMVAL